MEIEYPKYPFLWNYNDMFKEINYKVIIEIENDFDENTKNLCEIFPDKNVILINQKIEKNEINNLILNIQTTYLDSLNIFETNNSSIKIITNYKIDYKKDVPVFIYDPENNILRDKKFNPKNICIIKNINVIQENKDKLPLLYIRTHTIKGIIRFSPSNNSKINLNINSDNNENNENNINLKFYTVTEFSIIVNNIIIE